MSQYVSCHWLAGCLSAARPARTGRRHGSHSRSLWSLLASSPSWRPGLHFKCTIEGVRRPLSTARSRQSAAAEVRLCSCAARSFPTNDLGAGVLQELERRSGLDGCLTFLGGPGGHIFAASGGAGGAGGSRSSRNCCGRGVDLLALLGGAARRTLCSDVWPALTFQGRLGGHVFALPGGTGRAEGTRAGGCGRPPP